MGKKGKKGKKGADEAPPLLIAAWLESLNPNLTEYAAAFEDIGADNVAMFSYMDRGEVEALLDTLEEKGVKRLHLRRVKVRCEGGVAWVPWPLVVRVGVLGDV